MMFKLERTMNAQHKKTFERLAQNNRTEKFLFVVFFFSIHWLVSTTFNPRRRFTADEVKWRRKLIGRKQKCESKDFCEEINR